ncbi:MAG TPA: dephospho-CoA kinase [Candidatus Nanoarchaeia archaeon]|nr:dephospho-CoA kinase [Candidatus Nanoarchaeia archaeon]
MIVGITGSIGSGKTTVANLFKKHGFKVINADEMYHKLSKPDKSIYNKIIKEFGKGILNKDKTINRETLKKIVFSDPKKLKKLNSITHPLILKEIKKEINNSKSKNIVLDVPLLIEAGMQELVDKVIVIKCDEKTQIKRLLKKGKHTKKEILNILKSQMPIKEKMEHADFVIDNKRNLNHLKTQIRHKFLN